MKRNRPLAIVAALSALWLHAFAPASLAQSTFTIDPVDPLVDPISLAEFNTEGDQEGWNATQLDSPTVTGGNLSGTTNGGDTTLGLTFPTPYATGLLSIVTVDVRLRRAATDTTPLQVFWSDNGGGYAPVRSAATGAGIFPADGEFHTVRLTIRSLNNVPLNGVLKGLRIDAGQSSGTALDFDYIRLKVINGNLMVDPPTRLNAYTSIGEWNTAGNLDEWTIGNQISSMVSSAGLLSGLTSGGDPQIIRGNLAALGLNGLTAPMVEFRLRKRSGEGSRVDLFWTDASGGVSPARRTTQLNPPADGQFHVYQAPLGAFLNGDLGLLRFDPVADIPQERAFDLDYVRLGGIAVDTDNDGLADSVETNTGTFVSSRDTGSKPGVADSDGDGFSDGVELNFGTNPNLGSEFPTPALTGYAVIPALYQRNVAITPNAPTLVNGTPSSFSVTPALPAGLVLNPNSGVISGTPTTLSPSAPYAITATFPGGITSTYDLVIWIRDPGILSYGFPNGSYGLGNPIPDNGPTLFGPAPDSYSISPALPDNLFLDPFSGVISGTPNVLSPATNYTITADYANSPDSTFTISLRVKKAPVFVAADTPPLTSFVSLGEWETGLDGWTAANATATADGGILLVNSTATDPQLFKGALGIDPAVTGTLLEIRCRQTEPTVIEIFWGDASGGIAAARRIDIPADQIIADGQFHTYQVSFDGALEGNLTQLRVDPGVTPGRLVEFDYVRIGVAGTPSPVEITRFVFDPVFREATITWASTAGRLYTLQASSTLATSGSWVDVATSIRGDQGSTTFLDNSIPAGTTRRFYRILTQ